MIYPENFEQMTREEQRAFFQKSQPGYIKVEDTPMGSVLKRNFEWSEWYRELRNHGFKINKELGNYD